MSRPLRLIVPGITNLVVHGGNNGQHIFRDDADREACLRLLDRRFRHHQVKIAGFALCAVRSFFVAIPSSATAMSNAIQHAHSEYARGFNRAKGRRDSLFHPRFRSIPVSAGSLAARSRSWKRHRCAKNCARILIAGTGPAPRFVSASLIARLHSPRALARRITLRPRGARR